MRLSRDRTRLGSKLDMSTPSINIWPWLHSSKRNNVDTRLLLPLVTKMVCQVEEHDMDLWGHQPACSPANSDVFTGFDREGDVA